jgi:GT2 family glycosyltransferase
MREETVSVLVTLYNHENYIRETLESALAQTRPPYEIVVIDDRSTDGSVAAARRIDHPSVRIIESPFNLGGPTTVRGLLECKSKHVAILNSDDRWEPQKLEQQMEHLRSHPNCGVVFTGVVLIDEDGTRWRAEDQPLSQVFRTINRSRTAWLRDFFDRGNSLCASSAVVRRECFARLGPLDGRFIQLQDFEMWTRIAAAGYDIHIIEEPLTFYRVARKGTNLSTNSAPVRARQAYEFVILLRNYWKIQTTAELHEVFPEDDSLRDVDDRLVKFCLAQIAAQSPHPHHRQFAVDTMFDVAGECQMMALAAERFGFTHAHYRDFMAQNPLGTGMEPGIARKLKGLVASRIPHGLLERLKRARDRFCDEPPR